MQVILQFLSEPLQEIPAALVEQASVSIHLQPFEQHDVVYSTNEEPSTFYIVLAGALPSWDSVKHHNVVL